MRERKVLKSIRRRHKRQAWNEQYLFEQAELAAARRELKRQEEIRLMLEFSASVNNCCIFPPWETGMRRRGQ